MLKNCTKGGGANQTIYNQTKPFISAGANHWFENGANHL